MVGFQWKYEYTESESASLCRGLCNVRQGLRHCQLSSALLLLRANMSFSVRPGYTCTARPTVHAACVCTSFSVPAGHIVHAFPTQKQQRRPLPHADGRSLSLSPSVSCSVDVSARYLNSSSSLLLMSVSVLRAGGKERERSTMHAFG